MSTVCLQPGSNEVLADLMTASFGSCILSAIRQLCLSPAQSFSLRRNNRCGLSSRRGCKLRKLQEASIDTSRTYCELHLESCAGLLRITGVDSGSHRCRKLFGAWVALVQFGSALGHATLSPLSRRSIVDQNVCQEQNNE